MLLAEYVAGGFILLTFVIAIALGLRFGPVDRRARRRLPAARRSSSSTPATTTVGERILTALTVVLFLGGAAWFTGRVRERYGNPPWGRFEGGLGVD